MIDFSKYPTTFKLISSVKDLKENPEQIRWMHLTKEEAATAIAKQYILSECLRSSDIQLRKVSHEANIKAHREESEKVHSFAQTEAMEQLGLSYEDLVRLFPETDLKFIGSSQYNFEVMSNK